MKVLRQLVREFWFPLILGIAWTVFNLVGRPRSEWNARHILNVLGPTFFFMSWLVAQWYRVRKQQRVEDDLEKIHAGVRAIQEPLLPCSLFVTLKMDALEEDVTRVFKDQEGYRAYGPGQSMPVPPIGLPPGIRDGRLMRQDGYIDYTDGAVEAAGVFVLNHPGYNLIHCPVKHTIARIRPDAASKALLQNEPLFAPASVQLEFYFDGRPTSAKVKPSLVLSTKHLTAGEVVRACALDNSVFVDVSVERLAPSASGGSIWSVGNLKGAYLRATLDFFYLEDMHKFPTSSWPTLHNLQLWLGGAARQLLTFTPEQLGGQVTRENPTPVARGAGCVQIVFEYEIDANALAKGLLSTA